MKPTSDNGYAPILHPAGRQHEATRQYVLTSVHEYEGNPLGTERGRQDRHT